MSDYIATVDDIDDTSDPVVTASWQHEQLAQVKIIEYLIPLMIINYS